MATHENIFINSCMLNKFSIKLMVDEFKKWVYIEYQVSTLNSTFTPPTSPLNAGQCCGPQNGEIGERTVSAELGE